MKTFYCHYHRSSEMDLCVQGQKAYAIFQELNSGTPARIALESGKTSIKDLEQYKKGLGRSDAQLLKTINSLLDKKNAEKHKRTQHIYLTVGAIIGLLGLALKLLGKL